MKEIIEWLISMEHMAGEMYKDAADVFKEDKSLARFLRHLAEDEAWHFIAMSSAEDFIKREPLEPSDFVLNRANKARIEDPCLKIQEKVSRGTLTKESLIDCIVTIEFSEWNYFFLYVVNALKEKRREFEYAASKIEYHKKFIERYIEKLPNSRTYIKKMRHLPKVWGLRILLVEDYRPLRIVMSQLLSTEGIVETADDGETGLNKIRKQYYDIILLNAVMPGMNGMELYDKAVQHDPLLGKRFLFLIDSMTPGLIDFIKKNKVKYLAKPFPMHEVKAAMHHVLAAAPNKKQVSIFRRTLKMKTV